MSALSRVTVNLCIGCPSSSTAPGVIYTFLQIPRRYFWQDFSWGKYEFVWINCLRIQTKELLHISDRFGGMEGSFVNVITIYFTLFVGKTRAVWFCILGGHCWTDEEPLYFHQRLKRVFFYPILFESVASVTHLPRNRACETWKERLVIYIYIFFCSQRDDGKVQKVRQRLDRCYHFVACSSLVRGGFGFSTAALTSSSPASIHGGFSVHFSKDLHFRRGTWADKGQCTEITWPTLLEISKLLIELVSMEKKKGFFSL